MLFESEEQISFLNVMLINLVLKTSMKLLKKARKTSHSDGVTLRGFYRVQIVGDKGVCGDSGWKENTTTNLGVQQYIVEWLLGDTANGKSVAYAALGTGGAPAATDTALAGELTHSTSGRASVSTSIVASRTAQFTGAFNSANSFVTASANISNIGLFNTSTTNVGTLFAGNTYTSSSCAKDFGTCKSNFAKKHFQSRWISLLKTETIPNQVLVMA